MSNERQHAKDSQAGEPRRQHHNVDAVEQESMDPALALQLLRSDRTANPGTIQAARQLSGVLGNRALQRIPLEGELENMTNPDDALPADMQEFLSRGFMPDEAGQDITGPTMGGFNARFDPGSRNLIVTVSVGFNPINGLSIDSTTGRAVADGAGLDTGDAGEQRTLSRLRTEAARINAQITDPAARATEVETRWRWTDSELSPWMDQYRSSVQDAWGAQHFFVSEDWSQLQAGVRVVVDIHQGSLDTDHCKAKIVKTPPGGIGAFVQPGVADNPNDQELVMSSSSVNPSTDSLLDWQVFFENNSADINTAQGEHRGVREPAPGFLNKFINSFAAASPTGGPPIQLIGRASATGSVEHNQQLSEQRSLAVENYLKSNGLTGSVDRTSTSGTGEDGATEAANERRVDIIVASGEAQVVAAHEFGHMIGLDDEYVTSDDPANPGLINGTGNDVGATLDHTDVNDNDLGDVQIDGAVAENNDNIMSLGNTVRPQHYSTFHNALQVVTGKNWRYGGEGDAPAVVPGTPVPGGVLV